MVSRRPNNEKVKTAASFPSPNNSSHKIGKQRVKKIIRTPPDKKNFGVQPEMRPPSVNKRTKRKATEEGDQTPKRQRPGSVPQAKPTISHRSSNQTGLHSPPTPSARPSRSILKARLVERTESPEPCSGVQFVLNFGNNTIRVKHTPRFYGNLGTSHDGQVEPITPESGSQREEYEETASPLPEPEGFEAEDDMAPGLKLKLKTNSFSQSAASPEVATPVPQSAVRTPSITLKIGGGAASSPPPTKASKPKIKKERDTNRSAPGSSAKKRKASADDVVEEVDPRPPPKRKLTFKPLATPSITAPLTSTSIKLKSKGKIPKRPLGVGYDSELEDREVDPTILEGWILRMPPSPDCEAVREAIEKGTLGRGGCEVRMRALDTHGRRGILTVRGNQYATTLVDLPCIVEGMKSWDKKGWIKSLDVSQMMIVLGPCKTDEEARNYALPPDVDPKTYQYAHGLTAPMHWVRKRRFARTKRARVDDIEAVERRVNALLEADLSAVSSKYQILDHDPRIGDQYSSEYDDDDDDDAEGEEDTDDYFGAQSGRGGAGAVGTPTYAETPAEDIGQDEVDAFEKMFEEADDGDEPMKANVDASSHLDVIRSEAATGEASSFAVTSTSNSPSASASAAPTAAPTPVTAAGQTSDEDDDNDADDDDEEASDEESDDEAKDADENLHQAKGRIDDMMKKIKELTDNLKRTPNAILRKKIAKKIQDMEADVRLMRINAGMAATEDEE